MSNFLFPIIYILIFKCYWPKKKSDVETISDLVLVAGHNSDFHEIQ